jgi:hypothetical protein
MIETIQTRLLLACMSIMVAACSDSGPTGTRPASVYEIVVAAGGPTLVAGQSRPFRAILLDRDGHELSSRVVAWASESPEIATVSQTGLVEGKTPGMVVIRATSEGVTNAVAITVTNPAWIKE